MVTFVKDTSGSPNRTTLTVRVFFGFTSSLLSALAVGLFVQAIGAFDDPLITLGWPFYLITATAILVFVTTVLAAWSLYEIRREEEKEQKNDTEAKTPFI